MSEAKSKCEYCDLPIRETRQGDMRNDWEHMNGLSFCADGKHLAWPSTMKPNSETMDPVVKCVHCGLKISFYEGETRHETGSIFCKKKRGMTLMEATPKLAPPKASETMDPTNIVRRAMSLEMCQQKERREQQLYTKARGSGWFWCRNRADWIVCYINMGWGALVDGIYIRTDNFIDVVGPLQAPDDAANSTQQSGQTQLGGQQ